MCGLNYAIPIRALLRLCLRVEILTTGNIRHFLRNQESLDDRFARFESIISSLCSCDHLAYSDNECAK
jgi:hypothetical protein